MPTTDLDWLKYVKKERKKQRKLVLFIQLIKLLITLKHQSQTSLAKRKGLILNPIEDDILASCVRNLNLI